MTQASNPAGDLEGLIRRLHDAWCPEQRSCELRLNYGSGCPFYREVGQAMLAARGIGREERGLVPIDLADARALEQRTILEFLKAEIDSTADQVVRAKLVEVADAIRGDVHLITY